MGCKVVRWVRWGEVMVRVRIVETDLTAMSAQVSRGSMISASRTSASDRAAASRGLIQYLYAATPITLAVKF